ncbi:hypothetical protein [Vibrio barjaei]|uniref:hypothetical protein n=1 Tax=Vibrio barjaei TaxID=1676683 RepID=UPI002283B041|nr:hypothetical protein [Vibrio barjaei]
MVDLLTKGPTIVFCAIVGLYSSNGLSTLVSTDIQCQRNLNSNQVTITQHGESEGVTLRTHSGSSIFVAQNGGISVYELPTSQFPLLVESVSKVRWEIRNDCMITEIGLSQDITE